MIKEINIPNGWKIYNLGHFMDFKNGINASKESYGKGVKFVNVTDVFKSNILKKNLITGSVEISNKQKSEYSVKYGDILFNRTSETTDEIAYSSVYIDSEEITFGGFVIRGRQKIDILSPDYAKYCFKDYYVRKDIIRKSQGVVRSNIGQKDLNKVNILIPPKTEQKAIAGILEKWDEAIEKTSKLIEAKKKRFEWVRTELLDQVKNKNWQISRLSKISTIKKGEQLNRSELEGFGDYPAWNGGINPSGHTDKWNTLENTITISEGGNSCGFVNYCEQKFWCGGHCYSLLDVSKKIDPEFLYYFLKSKEKSIMRLRVGSGLPNIQKKDIDKLEVSYPELPQQKQIAKTLNTTKKEITILEEILANYKSQKKGLMQKLLTGKLRINKKECK